MTKVKIISGWSNPGGSTVAFINLCNLLNERGIECAFYGPHEWHMEKCRADFMENAKVGEEGEILICHFLKFPFRPQGSKKVILACHEKDIFPVKDIVPFWDDIVFVSESQKEWHGVNGKVIPNVISDLVAPEVPLLGLPAGVIGSIDRNKNTHLSIERAIEQGYDKIYLYGLVTDQEYYDEHVKFYVTDGVVEIMGHMDDKQAMYNSVSKVYHSSASETFNFVKAECEATGTLYDGLESAESGAEYWTKSQILKAWKEVMGIE